MPSAREGPMTGSGRGSSMGSPMGRGRPLPPPGPGMPGNLLGQVNQQDSSSMISDCQGVGNLELAREEERGWERGGWRWGHGPLMSSPCVM